jgi:CubicO group peptidase (beta-lactamase class C family)
MTVSYKNLHSQKSLSPVPRHRSPELKAAAAVLILSLTLAACASVQRNAPIVSRLSEVKTLVTTVPAEAGMSNSLNGTLDSIMTVALREHAAPGASLVVGRFGRIVHLKAYGRRDTAVSSAPVDVNTMYDMASITKVIATTTAAMILEEQGALDLDRTVASYLPGFNAPDKAAITMRMVMTHRGGLEAFAALYRNFKGREQYLEQINQRPLKSTPGTETVYSDWDMILTQLVIEKITGVTLDRFVDEKVFRPLGMTSTMFNPDASLKPRIAPTEIDTARGGLVWGKVHDENADAMGGVAGHAGLFSTAPDLAVFAQMLLNGGEYNGVRIVKEATIARWTAPQGGGSSRALGWDTPSQNSSAGRFFSPRSFGHTGFTGTSIWVDPTRDLFVILLTNRVDPTRNNNRHVPLRRAVADAAQEAILDAPLINWEAKR